MIGFLKGLFGDRSLRSVMRYSGTILGGNVAAAVLNLITLTLAARLLGAAGFGSLVLIQTYCQVVDMLANFQSWETVVKFGAVAQRERDWPRFGGLVRFGFFLDLSSAIVATLAALAASGLVAPLIGIGADQVWLLRLYTLVILFNLTGTPVGVLRLLNRFGLLALEHVLLAVVRLVAVAAALFLDAGFVAVVLIFLGSRIFSFVFLFTAAVVVMHRQGRPGWWRGSTGRIGEPLRFAVWSNLKTTTAVPVKYFDMIIVGAALSVEAVAVYKIFKEFARVLNQVTDPLFQVLFPEFSRTVGVNDSREALGLLKKSIQALYAVMVPLGIALMAAAPVVLNLFFGRPYVDHLDVLLLFIGFKIVFIGLSPLNPFFFAVGYAKYNTLIALVKNVLYALALYAACLHFGLYGVVAAYVLEVVFNFGVKTVILRRRRQEWRAA